MAIFLHPMQIDRGLFRHQAELGQGDVEEMIQVFVRDDRKLSRQWVIEKLEVLMIWVIHGSLQEISDRNLEKRDGCKKAEGRAGHGGGLSISNSREFSARNY